MRPSDLAGHVLFERIGVGGMGEVYRCGDDALGRDLAIKVLRAELRGDAGAEARFLREARLTGSLQHPGIVPVHHLGRLADGRPCYIMKLVRGRTLAELLRDEADGPERLPRLLAIVEKVCQTVAFAHSRSIIHRDLKPSNVMVGEFGEVQVMDWGLAKKLHAGAAATDPADRAAEAIATGATETGAWVEQAGGLSRAGAALGTPAYMPPEQAAGDWDIVDERADVFALGAMLCQILTRQPPYHGANRDELLRRARRGDLAEALGRLEQCGAPDELVQLCGECMAADLVQRPRHAGGVAERLAAYQADVQERLRRAEVERAEAQVKAREERKRRRLTALVAALMLLLVVLGGGAIAWYQRQRDKADQAVSNGLAQAELLAEQARADPLQPEKYHQALEAAQVASRLAENASTDLRQRVDALIVRWQEEQKAARNDRELLAALLDVHSPHEGPKYQSDSKGMMTAQAEPTADEQFAAAFRRWGLDVDGTPPAQAAEKLQARPAVVVTEVIAALDEWASERRRLDNGKKPWQPLTELAALLDKEPGSKRRELREIMARGRLPLERALGDSSALLRPVPIPVEVPLGRDRPRLRQLAEQTDAASEPILGLLTLVRALGIAGEEVRAEQVLRAAIVARPHDVVLHHALGQMLTTQKPPRWAAAVECYGAARAARPDLGVNLAKALIQVGRDREGLALLARLVRETPNNPYLHYAEAYALTAKGRVDEAMAEYRQAITLDPKYAYAHTNLGNLLTGKHDLDGAIACYKTALSLDPKLVQAHLSLGSALRAKHDLNGATTCFETAVALDPKHALAHNNLGVALRDKHDLDGAIACFKQALDLDPNLVSGHINLGIALADKGHLDEAMTEYRQALALDRELATAHLNLGNVLVAKGHLDEAMAEYRQALALDRKYALAHGNLGNALYDKGHFDESMAEYRHAIAGIHNNLGNVLSKKGRLDEAMAEYRQAIALDPKLALAHNGLGNALSEKRRLDEAIAEYRQAIAADPKDAPGHYNLGVALHAKLHLDEAMVEYRQAIRLKPDFAQAHCNLAHLLSREGRFDEALGYMTRGHELGSKQPGWRYPSAQWVRNVEQLVVLDKKSPAILTGEATPANPAEAIALASMCQQPYKKRFAASARLYADAFAAELKLATDRNQPHRYNAACSAALAAAGKGKDARWLPDKVTVMFRSWAMTWLRDELTAYGKLAQQPNPALKQTIQRQLNHWRRDPDLASVRDLEALDRLAENERAHWQALWRDVDELAKRVAEKDKPTKGRKEADTPRTKPERGPSPPSRATAR
jgi:serine/threonine-protein kinase